jgi:hypothetical protein
MSIFCRSFGDGCSPRVFFNYAEPCKPGGELDRIIERSGGRVLTGEEMKELFDGEEEG